MNGWPCEGDVPVEAGRTTEVTIRIRGAICTLIVMGLNPEATLPAIEGS